MGDALFLSSPFDFHISIDPQTKPVTFGARYRGYRFCQSRATVKATPSAAPRAMGKRGSTGEATAEDLTVVAGVVPAGLSTPPASVAPASAATPPASVSAVWAYFEKDASGNSVCKFCERVIKGHHSSNLLSHLRTAGRTDGAHQQANAVCEEHRESKRHIKRQKLVGQAASAANDYFPGVASASHLAAAVAAAAGGSPSLLSALKRDGGALFGFPPLPLAKEQRDSLPGGVYGVQPLTVNPDQFTQDLALMVLVDNLPLNFTTRPGLQYVMSQLLGEKRLSLPTEDAIAKSILMLQESMFLTTKMVLSRTKSVSTMLCMDGSDMWLLRWLS